MSGGLYSAWVSTGRACGKQHTVNARDDALHIRIWIVKLPPKCIVGSDQAAHNALIIAQKQKCLAWRRRDGPVKPSTLEPTGRVEETHIVHRAPPTDQKKWKKKTQKRTIGSAEKHLPCISTYTLGLRTFAMSMLRQGRQTQGWLSRVALRWRTPTSTLCAGMSDPVFSARRSAAPRPWWIVEGSLGCSWEGMTGIWRRHVCSLRGSRGRARDRAIRP